jgi:2-keto-4-pentenoate hydratase
MSLPNLPTVASALFEAFQTGVPIEPPTAASPDMTVDDAYAMQRELVAAHEAAGRRVVGRKIGLTSLAMQRQLGIDSPDFGVLLDSHTWPSGTKLSRGPMLQPKLEPEIAFVLAHELRGPGLSIDDVLGATAAIVPALEVIDSRVRDWQITLCDTVADNASCYGAVLGTPVALDVAGPLAEVTATLSHDGELLVSGSGEAVLGHPAAAIAWLGDELGRRGEALPAGEPLLAGSFSAAVDLLPGSYLADFGVVGSVALEITA